MNRQYLDIKSIDPEYWGKCGWIFLNSIALTFKPELKDKYKLFIEQLPYILPCKTCGSNLFKNMEDIDNALDTKENFLNWLLKIRNDIYYEQKRTPKTLKDNLNEIFSVKYIYTTEIHSIIITIVSCLVLLILIFLFRKERYKMSFH
jgi:hypothetical protein